MMLRLSFMMILTYSSALYSSSSSQDVKHKLGNTIVKPVIDSTKSASNYNQKPAQEKAFIGTAEYTKVFESIDRKAPFKFFVYQKHSASKLRAGELLTLKLILQTNSPNAYVLDDIDFSMPDHGHGMVTEPILKPVSSTPPSKSNAQHLNEYSLSGVKFQMPGFWQMKIKVINTKGKRETYDYNVEVL